MVDIYTTSLVSNYNQKKKQDIVMEDATLKLTTSQDEQAAAAAAGGIEIVRGVRDDPPSHYLLKMQNFSLFANSKMEKFESGDFEVEGYKWRLSVYPNGNRRSSDGHVSLYLVLSKSNTLPLGWEVNVDFKLFVYNQLQDTFLFIHDGGGKLRRFHGLKQEMGLDQFLPITTLNDASKGYLVDDCCIFGAEIFVIKQSGKGECLSMMKQPADSFFNWNIHKFSALINDQEFHTSKSFTIQDHNWRLLAYPKGHSTEKGRSFSLYLALEEYTTLPPGRTLYAEFTLRVRDQLFGRHVQKEANCHYSNSLKDWGHLNFLPLQELNNLANGYIVNDTLVVQVGINVILEAKEFS